MGLVSISGPGGVQFLKRPTDEKAAKLWPLKLTPDVSSEDNFITVSNASPCAERRAGELLRDQERNKGGRSEQKSYLSHAVTGKIPTLTELGISRMQSSRWQMQASLPEEVFEQHLTERRPHVLPFHGNDKFLAWFCHARETPPMSPSHSGW